MEFLDGDDAEASDRGTSAGAGNAAVAGASRLPTRSMPPTPRESSTATSSPRTSSSPSAVTPRFWISGWRRCVRRKAETFGRDDCREHEEHLPVPERRWARSPICRRNKCAAKNWMRARTCFPLASCSTRWRLGRCRSGARASGVIFDAILNRAPVPPVRLNPDVPVEAGRDHQQGSGERPQAALPERLGHAHRSAAAEA